VAPLVGRDRALRELSELLLREPGSLVLFGPPGVGKSRLARELVALLGPAWRLWDDPDQAPSNEELESRLVITQRESPGYAVRHRRFVEPLGDEDGVVLFESVARSHGEDPPPQDRTKIRSIVRRLDGLPLFIERAATLTVLSIDELSSRVERSLTSLFSIAELLGPSLERLAAPERRTLARLSVFRGSFDLASAESVIGERDVLERLQRLKDASLLRRIEEPELPGSARLSIYAVVRACAIEELSSEERGEIEELHATRLLEALEADHDRAACLRDHRRALRIAAEEQNLRAMLRSKPILAARAALLLDGLFAIRGPFEDHVSILSAALEALSKSERSLRGYLLRSRGEALRARRRLDEAEVDLREAHEIALELGDPRLASWTWQELGVAAREAGRTKEAEEALGRALDLARERGDRAQEGIVLGNSGTLFRYSGDLLRAREAYDQALAIHREVGNRRSELIVLGNIGHLHALEARFAEARVAYRAALTILEEIGDPRSLAIIMLHLGGLEVWEGRLDPADWLFHRACETAVAIGDRPMEAVCKAELAVIRAQRGQFDHARREMMAARSLLGGGELGWASVISLLEGAIDLAEGNRTEAANKLDQVLATSAEGAVPSTAHTELLRQSAYRLSDALGSAPKLSQTIVPPDKEPALETTRDGAWFRSGGERTSLDRRKPLRRILALLVRERLEHPNVPVSLESIIEAAWPGERLIPHSANTRAYVAISTLRRLGLGEAIVRRGGGYLIPPSTAIILSDS
jgi:tetratricopeptide (TPR) repeat protein